MIIFGMKLPEIFAQLVRGYRKVTGRDPEGLDLIKIRQESLRRFEDMNKVVDMQGRSIDTSKGIMGGKQIEDVIDDLPPPGSRGGPDDIAAPVMNVEDAPPGFIDFVRKTDPEGADKLQKVEDEIKAAIEAANKRAAKKLRNKKKKKDDPEKKADGGVAGLLGERSRYQRGGDVAFDAANEDVFGSSAISITPDTVMDQFGNQVQAEMGNTYNKPLIPQVTEQAANIKQSPLQSAAGIGGLPEIDMPVAGGNKNVGGILPVEDESFVTQPFFPDSDRDGIDDRLSDEEKQRFLNPDEYRTLVPEIPLGAKVRADLRRIPDADKNLDEVFQIDMTRPPGTPIGMEDSPLTVMPIYNNPLPRDELLSGFEQFKKDNPEVMQGAGTAAIIPTTLPGGYDYTFSGSLEANAFKKYLESIRQAPYQKRAQPIKGLTGFANGGRIGLKKGMDRRTFMKIMGGLTTLPILGKFFKGAEVAAPVAKKAVEVAGQAPSYFFDLVTKIKMLGKPGISIGPRQNTMNYKNYELMEDVSTGDIRVTKQKGDPDFGYEEEVMEYRKGQRTEDGMIPDEYEEATIRPDMDGKIKDIEDGIEPDSIIEIIKEVSDEAPSIKKAGGGIARMLGE